jgi:hypothetical protein
MIEGTSGEVTLLAPVTAIATNTGITAPSGSTGMKIHIILNAWLTSGTFTINGTGLPNNSEVVTVAAPTTQQTQSQTGYSFEYVSTNAYTAITNITTTGGVTGATLTVKGIQAAKYNIPVTAFKSNRKQPQYSPNEFSGAMARDKRLIAQYVDTSIDNLDSNFYGDLSMYWIYMMLGAPSWSTLPAAPLSVVASATIVASMTIANQPTAPGMKLIILASTFTGNPSITITGTQYGLSVNEVISPTANGTYYSANVYSAITTIGGTTNGTTLVITGVFGWKGTVTSEATKQTAAVEHFDGSASWTHPFSFASDGEFSVNTKGEAKLTMKGFAQDKLAIGDRTTTPLQTSRVTSLGIPLGDIPLAGWQAQVFVDNINGTAGTTAYLDPEEEIKIAIKTPGEQHWTFNNTQAFTRAYSQKYECMVDLTTDIIDLLQNEQFRQNLKQYLVVKTVGEYIGTTASVAYYKGWTWTLPVRYDGEYGQEAQPSKGNVSAKPKLRTEYDAGIAGSYSVAIITRQPPNYNL